MSRQHHLISIIARMTWFGLRYEDLPPPTSSGDRLFRRVPLLFAALGPSYTKVDESRNCYPHPHRRAPCTKYCEGSVRLIYIYIYIYIYTHTHTYTHAYGPRKYVMPGPR